MPEPRLKSETARLQLPATTRADAQAQGSASSTERKNLASRQVLLRRIVVEYDEMPGLCLTTAQAPRATAARRGRSGKVIAFKHILCPVDFSDTSARALTYATAFAAWYEAQLTVLHVATTFDEPPVPIGRRDRGD